MSDGYISRISGMLCGKGRAALMIRHAERYPIRSVLDSLGVGLTEKGKADATEIGTLLPHYPYYRLFHSPALRCRETAEGISAGIRSNRGRVTLIEEDDTLCSPYVKDERCLIDADRLGDDFLRSWLDGRIDPDWIHCPEPSMVMVLGPVLKRMLEGEGHLDIHVSHDWDIMLIRETLMGIRHEDEGWLRCLNGMVFVPNGHGYEALYADRRKTFDFGDSPPSQEMRYVPESPSERKYNIFSMLACPEHGLDAGCLKIKNMNKLSNSKKS
jgi:broad specificity phosphatase PhoE